MEKSPWWELSCVFRDTESTTVVLVLAGIKMIFFLVAGVRPCFGFVMEIALITQGCFAMIFLPTTRKVLEFANRKILL